MQLGFDFDSSSQFHAHIFWFVLSEVNLVFSKTSSWAGSIQFFPIFLGWAGLTHTLFSKTELIWIDPIFFPKIALSRLNSFFSKIETSRLNPIFSRAKNVPKSLFPTFGLSQLNSHFWDLGPAWTPQKCTYIRASTPVRRCSNLFAMQTIAAHPATWALPKKPPESTPAHGAIAAALLQMHRLIFRLGAGLI